MTTNPLRPTVTALIGALALAVSACGGADEAVPATGADETATSVSTDDATMSPATTAENDATTTTPMVRPTIVASTSIWADVVGNVACGDLAEVVTVIPAGVDSHEYEPSLQDRAILEAADLVVVNGLDLEEGLTATVEAVAGAGTAVFAVTDHVDALLEYGDTGDHSDTDDHGHGDDHGDDDHGDDDHGHGDDHGDDDHGHGDDHGDDDHGDEDDHSHDHSGGDPHIWFDPQRVASAVPALATAIAENTGLDAADLDTCAEDYVEQLAALDADLGTVLADIPTERRRLVTTHEALGYFAERYGFEVVGTALPGTSSMAETNPADLEALAQTIAGYGIPAVFAEAEVSDAELAAVADRLGDIRVIPLLTESLGPAGSGAETYVEFMMLAATTIADGLGG